jgi:glycine/D-amino acid oxidase-like deaminating enzyme
MRVVICGGGVIGASTAYFLSRRGIDVVVIERQAVASAASGKSGGFLALDWCDGSPLAPLARRSFALHGELADRLDGAAWGYRRLDTYSVIASTRQPVDAYRRLPAPDWLGPEAAVHAQLGSTRTTAQVDPAAFTEAMMAAAVAAGARLQIGTVTGLAFAADGTTITGALVDGDEMTADAVVIAMGPWSLLASRWLPLPPVHGLKGHSLVFDYTPPADGRALFVELEFDDQDVTSPEVFPRPDGTTYVCGLSSPAPLPLDPAQVTSNADADETLRTMTACFAPDLAAAPIVRAAACYRPVCDDGLPMIGAVPGYAGAYVATGHNVWGMLNGPATGEAMAELIADGGPTTIDIGPFDPGRLPALDPTGIQVTDATGAP